MTSPEILGKLGAKPNRFERAPSGGTSINGIDISHAMACGIIRSPSYRPEYVADIERAVAGRKSAIQSLLLRVKYAGDSHAIVPLVAAVTAVVVDLARRQEWQTRKTDIYERLAVLALRELEVIRPRRVLSSVDSPYECGAEKCRGCGGVGRRYSTRQNKVIDCQRCDLIPDRHGRVTSRRRWSDRERGDCCAMNHENFVAKWAPRLDEVMNAIATNERRALRRLSKGLVDDEDSACQHANSGL